MKIGRSIFEYHFLKQRQDLNERIAKLAGPAWAGVIFRECRVCLRFQMLDLDPKKDEWNENGHKFNDISGQFNTTWVDLVRLKYPRFTQKNIEQVICSVDCLKNWEQSEEGKKAWAQIKDRGKELPEDLTARFRIFGWNKPEDKE